MLTPKSQLWHQNDVFEGTLPSGPHSPGPHPRVATGKGLPCGGTGFPATKTTAHFIGGKRRISKDGEDGYIYIYMCVFEAFYRSLYFC